MSLDSAPAHSLIDEVVGAARRVAPGADVSVSVGAGRSANTRFACNTITSTGDVDDTTVAIGIAFGKRHAATTTNQTDRGALRTALDHAVRLAKIAPEDRESMPLLAPQRYLASPAAYDPSTHHLTATARADTARAAIAAADAAGLQIAGFHEHSGGIWMLGNSAGLRAEYRATAASLTMTARTGDGTGSGWAGALAQRAAEIDAAALTRVAVDKAVRSARPRRLDPGRYTVVLEPAAVGTLLGFLVDSLDARRADEGRSAFSKPGGTRVGDQLFADAITLVSDPTDPQTPGAPFDGEGFPLRRTTWIDKGTLAALTYSRFWAAKQGRPPSGDPSVFHLRGGTATTDALLQDVQRGVLITRFWYCEWVDPQTMLLTGLTRDGVFLIENGAVTGPVNNFRFNESPLTMLRNADALGRDTVRVPDAGGRLRVPALRTHEFNLASISAAV
ncbi:MAG TPA: TldD/PmbA family protein [Candidatus Acidoferrales bacterium]|nr:TldD/PmbA family protein [Candidatus Acidoferrales bacterium]